MKKTIGYILLLIVASYSLREILYEGVRRNKLGEYDKLNTVFLKKNNFTTILAGSSRIESHIITTVFDSITYQNSYNIGLNGQFMPVIYGSIKAYLVNSNAPSNIILNIDYHLYRGKLAVYRFPRFFPYLSNEALYEVLKKSDSRFWWFRWVSFYSMPFFDDNYLNAAFRGYAGLKGHYDMGFSKGYAPIPEETYQNMDTVIYKPFCSLPGEEVFANLDSIITLCKKNNINIIFVVAPIYYKGNDVILNKQEVVKRFKGSAEKYNIPFIDYTVDSICYNKSLFADPYHLNKTGAEIFTRKFAADVRQYLVK